MSIFEEPSKRKEKPIFSNSFGVKKKSKKQERRVASLIGGVPTPGSGAFSGHKGDIKHDRFLLEAKRTDAQSLSIKKAWLDKIDVEAHQAGKYPGLTIQIGSRSNCLVPDEDWV